MFRLLSDVFLDDVDWLVGHLVILLLGLGVVLVPDYPVAQLLVFGDILGSLVALADECDINTAKEEHLANLEVVLLGRQVQAAAPHRVITIQIRSFVLQKHVHYPWLPIPASDLQRHPIVLSLRVGIHVLLEHQVIDDAFVSNGARHV